MSPETPIPSLNPGWRVGQSIIMELDVILSVIRDPTMGAGLPPQFSRLAQSVPPAWRTELVAMLGETTCFESILETAASLAGAIEEGDYSRATLAMRELTLEAALARLAEEYSRLGLAPEPALPAERRLVELGVSGSLALFHQVGFEVTPDSPVTRRLRSGYEQSLGLLSGGLHHNRFWLWLDRFFFELYAPWRQSQAAEVEKLILRARAALGGDELQGRPPQVDWLPQQNPIRQLSGLGEAVQAGQFQVFFWVEPFGIADMWSLYPGRLIVSFAEPGALYENFQNFAREVASRTGALADPTRLIILRMIRHFGLTNTEIASFLGLSRPTVSIHAKILRQAGLIRSEPVGREMRHQIVPSELHRLFRDLVRLLDLPEE